jgi:hypothetical protein
MVQGVVIAKHIFGPWKPQPRNKSYYTKKQGVQLLDRGKNAYILLFKRY